MREIKGIGTPDKLRTTNLPLDQKKSPTHSFSGLTYSMPKILFMVILFMCTTALSAQRLVSGLDDIIRESENTSLLRAGLRMTKPDRAYVGMNTLYGMLLKRTNQQEFVLLSGMPDLFEGRVKTFLTQSQFPAVEIKLRNLFTEWSIVNFKMKKVDELIEQNDQMLIFVVDNSETSLNFASELMKKYPRRVARIYLRQTIKRDVPAGMIPFVTPLEIALHELKNGNLSNRDVKQLLSELENEKDAEKLIPAWSYCPVDFEPCQGGIFETCTSFTDKIRSICRSRETK